MKRKQISKLIPKVGIALIIGTFLILTLIGFYRDNTGEACTGFMGVKASCVEETALWPFGMTGFPVILFLGAWQTINYMAASTEPKKPKTKK